MTCADYSRYLRHTMLPGFGREGQEKLLRGSVLIVGAGGLGSPCALYLAAAGVGHIGVADGDAVSLSNLQRQIAHFTADVGSNKALSAAGKMRQLNPDVEVSTYTTFLTAENAGEIIQGYDFVLDCTDSTASKYLVNDACIQAGRAFCCGGVAEYGGQVMTHVPGSACYRCLFPEPPAEAVQGGARGVLGPAVGLMGSVQAAEAVKYLTGTGRLLTDSVLLFDTLGMDFRRIGMARNAACPVCGSAPAGGGRQTNRQTICP